MRRFNLRFKPWEKLRSEPPEPTPLLWLKRSLALTSPGLLLAVFLKITSISAAAPADAPASAPTPAESSLTASQSIARLYFAYERGPKPWTNYAGDAACLPCHKDMVHSYHQTDHYLASS